MCDLKTHTCKTCKKDYVCNVSNWLCPTVNSDENRNMCEDCEYQFALELEEYEKEETLREDRRRWEQEYGEDE